MERVHLNCSCLLLGDFRTSPRDVSINDTGWFINVNTVDNRRSINLTISQADILKIFAFLGKDKSYIFINLNEKKCLKIKEDMCMNSSKYTLDIRSKCESQRRVIIVLDDVVNVCHNILRQRFNFFHELKDRKTAENLFNYASNPSTISPSRVAPKRKIGPELGGSGEEASPSKIYRITKPKTELETNHTRPTPSRHTDDYTSDLSFELSKKQITNQALNFELELKKKKQDIISLRDQYYTEKELNDKEIKRLRERINGKEEAIRNNIFPRINSEIRQLERRIHDLKDQKKEHLEQLQSYNDLLTNASAGKEGLNAKYLNQIKIEHGRFTEMKSNLAKLKGAELLLNKKDNSEDDIVKYESLTQQIVKFEKKLECPVCLETCQAPIFQCQESHIICRTCRDKVKRCPQCLVRFERRKQRNRYAEDDAEELLKLYKERETVCNDIHETKYK